MFTKFNMSLCKPISTPMQIGLKFSNNITPKNIIENDVMEKILYFNVVRHLVTTSKCVLIHYRFH